MKVLLSPAAMDDLREIKDNIENTLQNPIAANNTLNKTISTYEQLAGFPEIGSPLQPLAPFKNDYRFTLANNYAIFYRVDDAVRIVRIIYAKRDFMRVLFGE